MGDEACRRRGAGSMSKLGAWIVWFGCVCGLDCVGRFLAGLCAYRLLACLGGFNGWFVLLCCVGVLRGINACILSLLFLSLLPPCPDYLNSPPAPYSLPFLFAASAASAAAYTCFYECCAGTGSAAASVAPAASAAPAVSAAGVTAIGAVSADVASATCYNR